MKFKYLTALFIFMIYFGAANIDSNMVFAKCEDSKKVINITNRVIKNPTTQNINSYISTMKKRVLLHGVKQDYEAQADDCRCILYFLRKNKKAEDYIKYYQKLGTTYEKIGFKYNQANRLEIAKNLYLEEKYFASAYEFLELASEDYCKEICYEFWVTYLLFSRTQTPRLFFIKKLLKLNL